MKIHFVKAGIGGMLVLVLLSQLCSTSKSSDSVKLDFDNNTVKLKDVEEDLKSLLEEINGKSLNDVEPEVLDKLITKLEKKIQEGFSDEASKEAAQTIVDYLAKVKFEKELPERLQELETEHNNEDAASKEEAKIEDESKKLKAEITKLMTDISSLLEKDNLSDLDYEELNKLIPDLKTKSGNLKVLDSEMVDKYEAMLKKLQDKRKALKSAKHEEKVQARKDALKKQSNSIWDTVDKWYSLFSGTYTDYLNRNINYLDDHLRVLDKSRLIIERLKKNVDNIPLEDNRNRRKFLWFGPSKVSTVLDKIKQAIDIHDDVRTTRTEIDNIFKKLNLTHDQIRQLLEKIKDANDKLASNPNDTDKKNIKDAKKGCKERVENLMWERSSLFAELDNKLKQYRTTVKNAMAAYKDTYKQAKDFEEKVDENSLKAEIKAFLEKLK
jgi:uncharacterized coiled-coil DUF342 family protein